MTHQCWKSNSTLTIYLDEYEWELFQSVLNNGKRQIQVLVLEGPVEVKITSTMIDLQFLLSALEMARLDIQATVNRFKV